MQCPSCGEWILVGVDQSGHTRAASVCVVTPQNVTQYLGVNRVRMYAVIGDGYLLSLSSREKVAMDAWRPEHPCGVPERPGRAAEPRMVDPCSFPAVSPGLGCQRETRSVTGCVQCAAADGSVPPFSSAPALGDPGAVQGADFTLYSTTEGQSQWTSSTPNAGSTGPAPAPATAQPVARRSAAQPPSTDTSDTGSVLSPSQPDWSGANGHTVSSGVTGAASVIRSGAEHVLVNLLGAVPIERTVRSRVVWRDKRYFEDYR